MRSRQATRRRGHGAEHGVPVVLGRVNTNQSKRAAFRRMQEQRCRRYRAGGRSGLSLLELDGGGSRRVRTMRTASASKQFPSLTTRPPRVMVDFQRRGDRSAIKAPARAPIPPRATDGCALLVGSSRICFALPGLACRPRPTSSGRLVASPAPWRGPGSASRQPSCSHGFQQLMGASTTSGSRARRGSGRTAGQYAYSAP